VRHEATPWLQGQVLTLLARAKHASKNARSRPISCWLSRDRRGYCSSTEMTRAVSFTPDERVEALSSCEISYSSPVMVKLLV
jgi:hypothetical protein